MIHSRGPLLQRMVALGHQVHAVAPFHVPDVSPTLESMGVEPSQYPLSRRGLNPFADIGSLLHLKQVLQRIRPDVVLSYSFKPVVYGSMAARMAWVGDTKRVYSLVAGLGYAFTRESGLKRRLLFNIAKGMYKAGMKSCDGVMFQNPDDLTFFEKLGVMPSGVQRTVVNGAGVDLEHFAVTPLPTKPVFLCVSRLLKSKGIALFVEAARRLKQKYPEAVFRLAGSLESGGDAIRPGELATWKKQGAVEFLNGATDVRSQIGGASVFVLPSYYREGTPRTVLEAMSMGRAIITSDAPGCRETVEPGKNGFLTGLKDVDAVTEAMERFILQPELAVEMGAASRELAVAKFNVDTVNDAILSFMGIA